MHTNVAPRSGPGRRPSAARRHRRPRPAREEMVFPALCPTRMTSSAPQVPCALRRARRRLAPQGRPGRFKRFNLPSAKKASERPLGDQNTDVAPSVPGNGRASRSERHEARSGSSRYVERRRFGGREETPIAMHRATAPGNFPPDWKSKWPASGGNTGNCSAPEIEGAGR